jgi:hypothetical protein
VVWTRLIWLRRISCEPCNEAPGFINSIAAQVVASHIHGVSVLFLETEMPKLKHKKA